jgi:phospholipid/cholesterol/gamma-HCH transport system substrate-binding protein
MSAAVKYRIFGLGTLAVILALILATVGSFMQVFTPSVHATVRTDRSGLLMAAGSGVTLHGIQVGKVRDVASVGDGAELAVALDPDEVDQIPVNVVASITAPTVFGTKYVQLDTPPVPSSRHITDGAVIESESVSTEVQTVLGGLLTLLQHVDVARLDSALGALSTTLNGRGNQFGELAVQLNRYLQKFNPSLPALGRDLGGATAVSNNLADAAPDLLRVLDNLSVTSQTLVDERPAVTELLTSLITVANDGGTLLNDNGDALATTLNTLRPTSGLLGRYSPMFPCLFASANQLRRDLEPIIGGTLPGIHTMTSFLPGIQGYENPKNLPAIDDSVGPTCFGGPLHQQPGDAPFPHVTFNDGTTSFGSRTDAVDVQSDPLPVLLFGDAARGVR